MNKPEIGNTKLETNSNVQSSKRYDLEDRTLRFAKDIRIFVAKLPRDIATNEDVKQLVRSSGSIGANYLEANESPSKKDFAMRIKISKKEARETIWWLELLRIESGIAAEHQLLLREATELMNILGAILRKTE